MHQDATNACDVIYAKNIAANQKATNTEHKVPMPIWDFNAVPKHIKENPDVHVAFWRALKLWAGAVGPAKVVYAEQLRSLITKEPPPESCYKPATVRLSEYRRPCADGAVAITTEQRMNLVPGPFRLFDAEPTEGIQMPLGIMFNYREATQAAVRGKWPPVTDTEFWEQVFKGFAKQAEFEGSAVAAYVTTIIAKTRAAGGGVGHVSSPESAAWAAGKGAGHVSSPESAAPQAPKLEENFHVLYHGAMRSNGFLKTPAAAAAVDSGGAAVVIDPWHWTAWQPVPTGPAAAASSEQQQVPAYGQVRDLGHERFGDANAIAATAADTGSAGQATSTAPALFPRHEEGAGHVPSPSPASGGAEVVEEC